MLLLTDVVVAPAPALLIGPKPALLLGFSLVVPPCNAEDNLRAGLIVIEAWFRGY